MQESGFEEDSRSSMQIDNEEDQRGGQIKNALLSDYAVYF